MRIGGIASAIFFGPTFNTAELLFSPSGDIFVRRAGRLEELPDAAHVALERHFGPKFLHAQAAVEALV